jgi:ubiquinone/menaquinone biosynthesis C-methylase UbiE
MDPKKFFYTEIAEQFDELMNPYDLQRRLEVVFDELLTQDLSGRRLLDVGCGTGHFSKVAASRGAVVTSLDVGDSLLRQALSKAPVRPVVGDALALPFRDGSFAIVVSSEAIEHTVSPQHAVTEMARVLEPRGLLALTCPNWVWKWSVLLMNALRARPFQGHENFPGYFQLPRMVRVAGLQVLTHRGLHPWPFQFRVLNGLSRRTDRALGNGALGSLMINQAVLARKPVP